MKDALIVSALSLVPRNHGARAMGWLARTGASRLATGAFVRAYGVDLSEAEGSLADYPTLEALFTRRLRPGARPVDPDPDALVSPVDGTVAAVATTSRGRIEVAPGRDLAIADLLGEPVDGELDVAVLYLSPRDYHRVHVPREGTAVAWRYVPGTLWPVFPAAVRRVDGLFARNERLVFRFSDAAGPPWWAVMVGAFGVGRITSPLCAVTSNVGAAGSEAEITPARPVARGEELGTFHLGSTVVLAAPPGRWSWAIRPGDPARVGRVIARSAAAPR